MLQYLHIENVALIEEAEIHFGPGLNILSGETGAGKSMVIDAITFALGERGRQDFIRKGAPKALVEALFVMEEEGYGPLLEKMGIPLEEDSSILITRTLKAGAKAINRVNGMAVTASMLKELSAALMDIHGQHEHQSLLYAPRHIFLLDKFCETQMTDKKKKLGEYYEEYKKVQKEIASISGDEKQRAQRMDILQFQNEEIKDAGLKEGEEESLQEKKKRLSHQEKIKKVSSRCMELLYDGTEVSDSAYDKTGEALREMETLLSADKNVEPFTEALSSIYVQLEDIAREIGKYQNTWDDDSKTEGIDEIEDRLNQIYLLKRKYGNSVAEILQFQKEVQKEMDFISNSEEYLALLTEKKEKIKEDMEKVCGQISAVRQTAAKKIEKKVEKELGDLEMKYASFQIKIGQKEEITPNGWDKVEFMISPNLGEEIKPLAKIASGGEMSRVMLALKSVLADKDTIETLVFDEIDTGVSGRTAQKVGEKMLCIGKSHQILCITHLPQIAAMADTHFLIEKRTEKDSTKTSIRLLDKEEAVNEIARLTGGAEITKTMTKAAREMKNQAESLKK